MDDIEKLFKLFCHNKSTILFSNNNVKLTKSKHTNIKFVIVKERIHNKQLCIEHINTNSIIGDSLTNGFISKMFHEHTAHMIFTFSESL